MSNRPEPTMKIDLLTFFSPFFAAGMIALVSAFPTPEAALNTMRDRDHTFELAMVGGPNGVPTSSTVANHTIIAETPCFDPGPGLTQQQLYACGEFVLDLLRAFDDERIATVFDPSTTPFHSPVANAEFLRMSATLLCRELWVRSGGTYATLDAPICRETTAHLDSRLVSG